MRAHYLQHVPFEGLGSIESWLLQAGFETTVTRFHESDELPDMSGVDLLIVMGGPMGANDEHLFPWLAAEKQYIRAAIESKMPTLGICLGAQLIARSMGGEVLPNPVKEIGWFPVNGIENAGGRFRLPRQLNAFHWHGDTFTLPRGAVRIASSSGCSNQGFQIGESCIGLQFHLETTRRSVEAIVHNCRDELVSGPFIQTEERILSVGQEQFDTINAVMAKVLEYLVH